MDYVAIMRKSWGMTAKILSGEKTVESRWYKNKSAPWGKIRAGDTVYFKNAGEAICGMARVKGVEQFESLNPEKVRALLDKYGAEVGKSGKDIPNVFRFAAVNSAGYISVNSRLVANSSTTAIEPFGINKKGFGIMAGWISVEDVEKIKAPRNYNL